MTGEVSGPIETQLSGGKRDITVLADRLEAVRPEQWAREGLRSDGAEFTTVTLARYLLHDVLHHLHDVGLLR